MTAPGIEVTYYDLCDLQYAGYFLNGIAQNESQLGYKLKISKHPPSLVTKAPFDDHWRGFLRRILLFHVSTKNDGFFFCIDPRDPYDPDAYGTAYHLPLLETVRRYYKVNYHEDSLRRSEAIQPYRHKIRPAPIVFPLRPTSTANYYPSALGNPCGLWPLRRKLLRIKDMRDMASLSHMRKLRSVEQDIDIFFVTLVRDNPIQHEYNEFRYEIVRRLSELRGMNIITGFVGKGDLDSKYRNLLVSGYKYRDYLTFLARSRVNIYVRGLFDCFSFKLGELLAMGKPMVGQTIHNQREKLYQVPHLSSQFAHHDPEAIVEAALNLLNSEDQRQYLSSANADYFDRQLDPRITLNAMLTDILESIPTAA